MSKAVDIQHLLKELRFARKMLRAIKRETGRFDPARKMCQEADTRLTRTLASPYWEKLAATADLEPENPWRPIAEAKAGEEYLLYFPPVLGREGRIYLQQMTQVRTYPAPIPRQPTHFARVPRPTIRMQVPVKRKETES